MGPITVTAWVWASSAQSPRTYVPSPPRPSGGYWLVKWTSRGLGWGGNVSGGPNRTSGGSARPRSLSRRHRFSLSPAGELGRREAAAPSPPRNSGRILVGVSEPDAAPPDRTTVTVPLYYSVDCIPAADGRLVVVDVDGGVGRGLDSLGPAYGRSGARDRLKPYLERLNEVAGGRRILFIQDLFAIGQTFPDDFFEYVQRHIAWSPITDWVPDLQEYRRKRLATPRSPEVAQIGAYLDPLAARAKIRLGYCDGVRVQRESDRPKLLLSSFSERGRQKKESVIVDPAEVGVAVFSGRAERFPDDLRNQDWFPVINPPVVDRLLENKWLLPRLLEGTAAAEMLPRWVPVGMGLRTADEIREFAASLHAPDRFPLAVMKPTNLGLSLGVRFLDRTGLRSLAARQPARRLPEALARELLDPRIAHTYDEVTHYRGKQLDNLLRTPGARVHDHGDGTFHYSAPYPFLETTVALLQEFVESRPIRSRRTGRFHRGHIRAVLFGGALVSAVYRLDAEPDDGTFRDLSRPEVRILIEGMPADAEADLQERLGRFFDEVERQLDGRIHDDEDLTRLRDRWVTEQCVPA